MSDKYFYNDNELLYLIKNNNEEAYLFLIKKYRGLIFKMIRKYAIDEDDGYQEGLICLYNAINKYDSKYNKSFNKYFEQLLTNRFIDLKHEQQIDYRVIIDSELVDNYVVLNEGVRTLNEMNIEDIYYKVKDNLKGMETFIFIEYYMNKKSPKEISSSNNLSLSSIYHIIYRIKRKIKKYVVK